MTRPELIEVLARAMCSKPDECVFGTGMMVHHGAHIVSTMTCGRYAWQDKIGAANAILAAIEAQGLAIVPVEATEAEIDAIKAADAFKMNRGLQIEDVLELRTSMIAAGRI